MPGAAMNGQSTMGTAVRILAAAVAFSCAMNGCQKQAPAARASQGNEAAKKADEPGAVAQQTPPEQGAVVAKSPENAQKSEDGVAVSMSPSLPFSMWASRRGQIAPGEVVPLTFTLQSSQGFDQVKTTVRALKGVIVSGDLQRDHKRVSAGARVRHEVNARADKGVAGYVVVDIAWQGADGAGSTTVGVEIRAIGAEQKLEKLGTIETDSEGNRVQVMKAQMR